jgi:serine/threonine protein phosphatase PrpC
MYKSDEIDEFIIVASDGLWDVFSSQDAVNMARGLLQKNGIISTSGEEVIYYYLLLTMLYVFILTKFVMLM